MSIYENSSRTLHISNFLKEIVTDSSKVELSDLSYTKELHFASRKNQLRVNSPNL